MVKKNGFPKRGDVFWVNLDPAIGAEIKKKRPALIISNDIGNETSKIVMIAPLTSKIKNIYSFEVKITLNGKSGKIMLNQSRAIDKSRLINKISHMGSETMKLVDDAIKVVFGLN